MAEDSKTFDFLLDEGGQPVDLFGHNEEIAQLEESSPLLGTGISGGVSSSELEATSDIGIKEIIKKHTNLYENYVYTLMGQAAAGVNYNQYGAPMPTLESLATNMFKELTVRGIPLNEAEDLVLDIYSGRKRDPRPLMYSTGEDLEYVFPQEMAEKMWEERDIIPSSDDIGIKISKYFK